MKILLCHTYYQHRGGEDESFSDELRLLESYGHDVLTYTRNNREIAGLSTLTIPQRTVWNRGTYRDVRRILRDERPEVMHCTNTFPLLSPSIYYAARAENVAVVQSLRNYRLQCLNGLLYRRNRVCEDCVGKIVPWPGVLHGCYRDSRAASAVVAAMLSVHRGMRTWNDAVDRFVTLTQFARDKLVQGGLPERQIEVKPNFVLADPGVRRGRGGYAVFVGRLSSEKGLDTLLRAWAALDAPTPLKIVGEGPIAPRLKENAVGIGGVEFLGRRPLSEVFSIVGDAAFLIIPSEWYETFGRTIAEAFAVGTPVIAARHGAMAELVADGQTGLHFTPGDADELASKVQWMFANPQDRDLMRRAARREYESKYTAAANHEMLLAVYRRAIETNAPRRRDRDGRTENRPRRRPNERRRPRRTGPHASNQVTPHE